MELVGRVFPSPWGTCISPGNAKLWSRNSVLDGLTQRFMSGSSLMRVRWFVQGSLLSTGPGMTGSGSPPHKNMGKAHLPP